MFEFMFFTFTSQTNKIVVCVHEVLVCGLVVVALDAIRVEALSNGGGVVEPGARPPREGVATSAMTFGKAARLRSRSKRAAQSATTRVAAMSSFASAICSLPTVAPGRSSKG